MYAVETPSSTWKYSNAAEYSIHNDDGSFVKLVIGWILARNIVGKNGRRPS
jgi:hypothetical protein